MTTASRNPSPANEVTRPGGDGAGAQPIEVSSAWVLPGTGRGRSAQLWSLAILGALLASRLLLFPNGPWEQDEALFATGVISFDVPRHQPHPPGFPGWILLGKLLLPLTRDALVALRLWSSVGSVAMVWLLSRLLAPLAGPSVALAASLAFALSPLTWSHSARAFTTVPALTLGLLALYAWVHPQPLTRSRALIGWALLGFAVTVRPQLAPELAMVGIVGLWCLRSRPALALAGVGLSLFVVVTVFGVAIADSGFDAFWAATRQHFGEHFEGRVAPKKGQASTLKVIAEWGFVRTGGGIIGASLLLIASALGLFGIFRKNWRLAIWWLTLIAVTSGMLMFAHSPRAPRYQVGLLLILAGPVAVAFSRLGRRIGAALLATVALVGAIFAYPAVRAMHDKPLPVVAALRAVAARHPRSVVHPGGLFSFAKLLDFQGLLPTRASIPFGPNTPLPRDTYALGSTDIRFLEGPNTCSWTFNDFPEEAWDVSQRRFNRTTVARNPVLFGPGIYGQESVGKGRRAAWLSEEATLYVPTPSEILFLKLEVRKGRAPQRLLVSSGENKLLEQSLNAGMNTVAVPLASCDDRCRVLLRLPDAWTGPNDRRTLSARLWETWAVTWGDSTAWKWHPEDTQLPPGVELAGFYPPEQGQVANQGRWTYSNAVVRFEAGRGTLVLSLRRPQYTAGIVRIATEGSELLPELGSQTSRVAIRVDGGIPRKVNVSLQSPSFTPARVEGGSTDTRSLALQVTEMAFLPDLTVPCEQSL